MSVQTLEAAAAAYADARTRLQDEVRAAQQAGVPDAAIARAAGVSRQTVRTWTGKTAAEPAMHAKP